MQELRIAQTGVQVLLAFLLTAPLQAGFVRVGRARRALLLADLTALTVAAVCLIGPVAWHPVLFRQHVKDEVDLPWAVVFGLGTVLLAIVLWLVLPWRQRRPRPRGPAEHGAASGGAARDGATSGGGA